MEPLSLANVRARHCTLLPLPHVRRVPVRFSFSFFLFSFADRRAILSAPPSHVAPSLCVVLRLCHVLPLSRCAFVMRHSCRIVPLSCVTPVALRLCHVSLLSCCAFVMLHSCRVTPLSRLCHMSHLCHAFATRRAFITPRLATLLRLLQTCGGNGGEREWVGGQGGM